MRKKITLVQIFFIPIIIFFTIFGYKTLNNGSKGYNELSFIKGRVTKMDSITHVGMPNKNGVREIQTIFLFEINNGKPIFGIIDNNKIYKTVRKKLSQSTNALVELYYDKSGKEIMSGITLHIYELKVNNIIEKSLNEEKEKHYKFSLLFFSLATIFAIANLLVSKMIIKKFKNVN